jgi:hypothetical protein
MKTKFIVQSFFAAVICLALGWRAVDLVRQVDQENQRNYRPVYSMA